MPKPKPKPKPTLKHKDRTQSERLVSVNETKVKCMEHDLMDDLATKILYRMLDNYYNDGTTYINKELKLTGRHVIPRKYVVNLYNDSKKKDCVLIRALDDEDIQAKNRAIIERNARNTHQMWKRDSDSESGSDTGLDSGSDTEPELVPIPEPDH